MYDEISSFKVYNYLGFTVFPVLYNSHQFIISEHYHHPQINPESTRSHSSSHPLLSPGND